MSTDAIAAPRPRSMMGLAGWVLTGLTIAFLLMDAGMKVANLNISVEATKALGFDASVVMPLGALLLVCTIFYAVPATSVLGAVLITGYFGGAVATHVHQQSPLFSHVLFGVYVGVLMWGGLWLRDARLRALFPLRFSAS